MPDDIYGSALNDAKAGGLVGILLSRVRDGVLTNTINAKERIEKGDPLVIDAATGRVMRAPDPMRRPAKCKAYASTPNMRAIDLYGCAMDYGHAGEHENVTGEVRWSDTSQTMNTGYGSHVPPLNPKGRALRAGRIRTR